MAWESVVLHTCSACLVISSTWVLCMQSSLTHQFTHSFVVFLALAICRVTFSCATSLTVVFLLACCWYMQSSPTPKYTRSFVVFLALAICKIGISGVSSTMDQVQPKILFSILEQVGTAAEGTVDSNSGTQLSGACIICCV